MNPEQHCNRLPQEQSFPLMQRAGKKAKRKRIAIRILSASVAVYALIFFVGSIIISKKNIGIFDFFIFVSHARMYIDNGILYSRDLSLYAPGMAIYKFPPLYAGILVELIRSAISENQLYIGAWLLQIACLIASIILCLLSKTGEIKKEKYIIIIAFSLAFSFSNSFLIENSLRLQLEPYILFLASASLLFITKNRPASAGLLISMAASLKIYPAFLLLYAIFSRKGLPIVIGAIIGLSAAIFISFFAIDEKENYFYLSKVLPILLKEQASSSHENISITNILISPLTSRSEFIQKILFIYSILLWLWIMIAKNISCDKKIAVNSYAVDFASLYTIMLISMPNFWWNYQILNILPAIVAIKIIFTHPNSSIFPALTLLSAFIFQTIIAAEYFLAPYFTEIYTSITSRIYSPLRSAIQPLMLCTIIALQFQEFQRNRISTTRDSHMNKWGIIVSILILLTSSAYWIAAIPASASPEGEVSNSIFVRGSHPIIIDKFKAIDESRKTQPNNDYAGSDVRVLKGKVWRPAGLQAPGPLLVYSHGFMSFHEEGKYLTRFLASHGYTVVAVDYPLTNFFAPGKPKLADVVNQPGDVSFLIDTMLKRNADPNDVLFNTIDPKKIAVDGVSLGGMTSTLVAFHGKVFDKRIAAVISTAGPAAMFTPDFFASNNIPFMMIGADGDAMVPYQTNAAPIPQKKPGSILVNLKNASHAGFAQPASTLMRFFNNPDSIGCKQLTKNLPADTSSSASFIPGLDGAEYGIDFSDRTLPCSSGMPDSAMKASRQHMFTTLAVYSFLESVFANDLAMRNASREYLLNTLPAENGTEITVTQSAQ